MQDKLRECFEDMVVYKDLKESNFFKGLKLPSFLRDWLLKMFEDDEGKFDVEEITEFVRERFQHESKIAFMDRFAHGAEGDAVDPIAEENT